MNKFKTVVLTVLFLWLLSYFLSLMIVDDERVISEGIAIVPIYGAISIKDSSDFLQGSFTGSDTILSNLKKANENKAVKAIILEINSPGGTVVASKEVADYVEKIKKNKPVVAWIREVGASGAYWIASSSSVIVADELSITGSIGVISSYLDYSDLLEDYGVKYERLVAGDYKDTGSPFKDLNDQERIILESKLKKIQSLFLESVVKNRKLTPSQTNEVKSALFYLGIEAKDLGLVDILGGREEAILKARELANIEDGQIIEYKSKKSILDLLESISSKAFFNVGLGIGSELKQDKEFKILA